MRSFSAVVLSSVCALIWIGPAEGQGRGTSEWTTAGADAQRSSWIRTDPKISVAKLQHPGFAMTWKIKLSDEPTLASTLDHYIGYRGFRSFALMGSTSGEMTAIDTDLGRIEWQKKLAAPGCGMTSNVTRASAAAFLPVEMGPGRGFGGGGGRGGAAKSGVGEPGEGAITIRPAVAPEAALVPTPPALTPAPNAGRGGPGGPNRMAGLVNAISSDGMFHSLYVSNGEEPAPAIPFLPANVSARQLTVVNNIAYAGISQACDGAVNAIWAVDLASKEVAHWTAGADIAGSGFAFGHDATLFAATTGGDLVALDPKTLEVRNTYKADGQSFSAAPVIFEYKSRAVIAVPTREGQVHLVDAVSLTGAAYPAPGAGALTTWQDAAGIRWIAALSKDSIAAWKVLAQNDAPALAPGWTSSGMASPVAAMVVNGVVFAVSNSPSAVLHALDGATGRELWSSGKTMLTPVRVGGLSGSGSQLYVGTSDGTIYAFGFPIEH
jgi:outer membrane protein assembly factor BamB